eukprot:GHRR01003560.1.p1 GENE.GHRR01003560.1~~GHRR01003560.1.p1  ORF type:complete len:329 (+),score=116.00 GHRR01003560.1:195-1181(+)
MAAGPMLPEDFREAVTGRLSQHAELALPAAMTRERAYPTGPELQAYLSGLLQRDPAVFLERYGKLLSQTELEGFQLLQHDYEVSYWLQQLGAVPSSSGSNKQQGRASSSSKALSTTAKNRRLAYMRRLECDGEYFSEDSMRAREPLIWHEYIGQHEGQPAPPTGLIQGGGLAASLLRSHDELLIRARLQQQLEEQECQESEHDSDSEGDDNTHNATMQDVTTNPNGAAVAGTANGVASDSKHYDQEQGGSDYHHQQQHHYQQQQQGDKSACAMWQRRQEFLDEMQSRFLSGMDHEHQEYAAIDADVELDEDWAAQQAQDAEDAYFDAD